MSLRIVTQTPQSTCKHCGITVVDLSLPGDYAGWWHMPMTWDAPVDFEFDGPTYRRCNPQSQSVAEPVDNNHEEPVVHEARIDDDRLTWEQI
jgi:hypothetical protein